MLAADIFFSPVLPEDEAARLVYAWRDDPDTRRYTYHPDIGSLSDFYQKFKTPFWQGTPRLPSLFILYKGLRVGFLRFAVKTHPADPQREAIEISILIDPASRGQGIGSAVLKKLPAWIQKQGYNSLYGEIQSDNLSSIKAFVQGGFEKFASTETFIEDTGQTYPIDIYVKELTDLIKRPPIFIVAEAGSNWRQGSPTRDLKMAKALVDVAKEAGADAVKFQVYRSETTYAIGAGRTDYLEKEGFNEDIDDLFKDLAMPYEMVQQIAAYCRNVGIEFMATPFSLQDFQAVDPFVKRHKIASYEIGHVHLIRAVAKSGKPLILSTGAATLFEVRWALDQFYQSGGYDITLLQCTACYPADEKDLNLKVIENYQELFGVNAGLSDHSRAPFLAGVAAAALGASYIEKHFTLSRKLPGPDHAFAIEPEELKQLVESIRSVEQMLGSPTKKVSSGEEELRDFAHRGLQAIKEIQPGEIMSEGVNYEILRPGKNKKGAHAVFLSAIENKKAIRRLISGEGILPEDVQ